MFAFTNKIFKKQRMLLCLPVSSFVRQFSMKINACKHFPGNSTLKRDPRFVCVLNKYTTSYFVGNVPYFKNGRIRLIFKILNIFSFVKNATKFFIDNTVKFFTYAFFKQTICELTND